MVYSRRRLVGRFVSGQGAKSSLRSRKGRHCLPRVPVAVRNPSHPARRTGSSGAIQIRGKNSEPHAKLRRFNLLLVLTVLLASGPVVMPAAAEPTEPMILTSDTTLSEDHTGPIIIASNDITLDCGGHTVSGSFPDTGILVEGRTGVTVENCHVTGFAAGIRLRGAYQNTLASNLLVSNTDGVDLLQSGENNLVDNQARSNGIGFYLSGSAANNLSDNIAEGNGPAFYLDSSAGNTLDHNTANHNTIGYRLVASSGNTLANNQGSDNNTDYSLQFSDNNILQANTANGLADGFSLFRSNGNTLTGNTASQNDQAGFRVVASTDNTITGNTIDSNNYGILVCKTVLRQNTLLPNKFQGPQQALAIDKTC